MNNQKRGECQKVLKFKGLYVGTSFALSINVIVNVYSNKFMEANLWKD